MRPSRALPGLIVAVVLGSVPPCVAAEPAATTAPADVVLLDFVASWCGPCRQMAPLVGEISAAGWIVRQVDVDREHDLVKRFGVTGVPCYVLLVKGHEAGRINGATTREALLELMAKAAAPGKTAPVAATAEAGRAPGIPLPVAAAAAPLQTETPRPSRPLPTAEAAAPASGRLEPASPAARAVPVVAAANGGLPAAARAELERRLMEATARLRVEDSSGVSWGTGTVIDCRQGEALILTCGHIFRDSQGKGRIAVDLFGRQSQRGVAGQLVSWDLKRDLALVSVFTDEAVEAVRVGSADRRTVAGDPVVTVGCNGGADPTIHHSRVTAVDKYLGPPNVQVAGQPVQGRSGGGLFAIDGTLIGVCNAADPEDNEGLFAALPAVHEQLEEAGLAFVYRNVYPSDGLAASAAGAGPHVPAMPAEMPAMSFDRRDRAGAVPTASTTAGGLPAPAGAARDHESPPASPAGPAPAAGPLSSGEHALLDHVRQQAGRAEVICIVRPHGAAEAESEVFVLKGSSRAFVERLAATHAAEPESAVSAPR